MTAIARTFVRIRNLSIFLLAVTACATDPLPSPIEVEATDGARLAAATSIQIAPVRSAEQERMGISSAAADSLRQRAAEILRVKGYEITSSSPSDAEAGDGDVMVEIEAGSEAVSRRTWSSDPDASGARLVRRDEAVVRVRVLSRVQPREIWRSDARRTVPARSVGKSADSVPPEIWNDLLEAALARVPVR